MVAGVCRPSTFSRSPAHVRSCGSVPSPLYLYKGEREKKRAAQRRRAPPQAAHDESHSFHSFRHSLTVSHAIRITAAGAAPAAVHGCSLTAATRPSAHRDPFFLKRAARESRLNLLKARCACDGASSTRFS